MFMINCKSIIFNFKNFIQYFNYFNNIIFIYLNSMLIENKIKLYFKNTI